MLRNNNIPKEKIYIFLHNEKQKKMYETAIPSDMYGKIVLTKLNKGIVGQRNYIMDYFTENQRILSLDDDLAEMLEMKNGKLVPTYRLKEIIERGFDLCEKHGYTLWGVYPVANAFYMKSKEEYTTDLRFIIGAFMGIINKKRHISLDIKHDYEQSIEAYLKDGGVIRFNHISFKTKYYNNKGGIGSNYDERLNKLLNDTGILIRKYPELVYENKRRKGEVLLRKGKGIKGGGLGLGLEGGKITMPIQNVEDKENSDIIIDKIEQTPRIKILQEKIVEKLNEIKISKTDWTREAVIGKGYTFSFGAGTRKFRTKGEYKANTNYPELFHSIVEYGNAILPTGFEYEIITVNKNLKAKKHTDKYNSGIGFITMLGDYTGGGLYIYENGKPKLYDTHNTLLGFNGAIYPHRTEPFKGTRYALIFYKQNGVKVKGVTMEGSGLKVV